MKNSQYYKLLTLFLPNLIFWLMLYFSQDLLVSHVLLVVIYNIIIMLYSFMSKIKWEKNLQQEIIEFGKNLKSGLKALLFWTFILFTMIILIFNFNFIIKINVIHFRLPYLNENLMFKLYHVLFFIIFNLYLSFTDEIYFNLFMSNDPFILRLINKINYGFRYTILFGFLLPLNIIASLIIGLIFCLKEISVNLYQFSVIKNYFIRVSLNLVIYLIFCFIYNRIFVIKNYVLLKNSYYNFWNYYNYY